MNTFAHQILDIAVPLGAPALVLTVILTALFCRHRIAGRKPVSYGTAIASAAVASVAAFFGVVFYKLGWSAFTARFWRDWFASGGASDSPATVFTVLWIILLVCIFPALGIVGYFQGKARHDHVA